MSNTILRASLYGLTAALVSLGSAHAHEIAGNRFFPATLAIDDPGVNDELAFPTISAFKTGNDLSAKELDVSAEFAKRITDDFAVSFEPTWTRVGRPGGPTMNGASGFQNLETALKYRVFKNAEHEFIASVGLNIEWGGSGAEGVGAEPVTLYTPSVFFGKGFGDLPDSMGWARPFAITGQIGYAFPGARTTASFDPDTGLTEFEMNPDILVWGGSLQYSMPYLKSAVVDLGLPDFLNHLIPIVEFSMETPTAHTLTSGTITTGTINPGVIWVGEKFQVGIEAVIPVNGASGRSVGVIGQLHLYLDDIFPSSIGRPLLASAMLAGRPKAGQ